MSDTLDARVVTLMTTEDLKRIDDWRFSQRISGRGEAVRQLIAAGLVAVGAAAPVEVETADLPAPKIPQPHECGQPFLGELILPWLRAQGKRVHTMGDVLQGVFNETEASHAIGRDKAVGFVFKAIGWRAVTNRKGGVTTRSFVAPQED
jgi:hypothetical protein